MLGKELATLNWSSQGRTKQQGRGRLATPLEVIPGCLLCPGVQVAALLLFESCLSRREARREQAEG